MRMNYLSKKDAAKLVKKLRELSWGKSLSLEKPKRALKIEGDEFTIYRLDGLLICEKEGAIFPTIHEEYNREVLEKVPALVVDMGAVPYIARGADVMRPGVRKFEGEFDEGEIVVVRDERHFKPLAIAVALKSRGECVSMEKGKIAENIHHVNDKIWKLVQENKRLIDRR